MSGDQPADIRKQESELYLQPGQLLHTGKTVLDAVHIGRETTSGPPMFNDEVI